MNWTLELIPVPVSDVGRAQRFYADQVGFNIDFEHKNGDEVALTQLTPPGSGCSIGLGKGMVSSAPGSLQGLQLVVKDLHAARAELVERGVDVSEVQVFDSGSFRPAQEGDALDNVGCIFFKDPDGNSWTVQQISSRS